MIEKPVISKMRIKVPDDVMGVRGMTEDRRIQIEKAITLIEKHYDLRIGEIFIESLGPRERNTYFMVGPYETEEGLKMGLAINTDIDYTQIDRRIRKQYESGFFASRKLEDCVAHEMAHILTFQGCKAYEEYATLSERINKTFVRGISGYADESGKGVEALAEAFVKYRNGEKIPFRMRQLIKKIHRKVEKAMIRMPNCDICKYYFDEAEINCCEAFPERIPLEVMIKAGPGVECAPGYFF